MKILLSLDEDAREEVITYNQLLDYLARDNDNDIVWKFNRIVSHHGTITSCHPDCNGSMHNLLIEWENAETTKEPLQDIAKDDQVTCAIYAKENGLLDLPGWKQFKSIARCQKTSLVWWTRQNSNPLITYLSSRMGTKYLKLMNKPCNSMRRMVIPSGKMALRLSSSKSMNMKLSLMNHTKSKIPNGYEKIRVHFVFDVKQDGRHKARLVADGHLTEVPLQSVYSEVTSLQGFHLVLS
jgi:hypothetical protein